MKQTCLYNRHVSLGALMSPFAGFDMPISYEGITQEHKAVRTACGVFDVSHMGEVMISGPEAAIFTNLIFSNDILLIKPGAILYGMMLNEAGGVVDDLLVYKIASDRYLLVINASNIDKDLAWIRTNAEGFDLTVEDLSDTTAEIAVQGPEAETLMKELLGFDCSDIEFYHFRVFDSERGQLLISRTGYTGEDGFEIYASPEIIGDCWDTLIASGRCAPCGLGCRDTLRFEVALPLYGDELTDEITPLEAGLSIFVKTDKPDFIGRDAIMAQKEQGVARKIVGIEILDRAIARHGYEVLTADGSEVIGTVTTGYRGISTDRSIALALIDSRYAALDTPLSVRIRRKVFPAKVVSKRFYKKSYKK